MHDDNTVDFRACHYCAAIEDLCIDLMASVLVGRAIDSLKYPPIAATRLPLTHEEETKRRINNMGHGRLPRDDGDGANQHRDPDNYIPGYHS